MPTPSSVTLTREGSTIYMAKKKLLGLADAAMDMTTTHMALSLTSLQKTCLTCSSVELILHKNVCSLQIFSSTMLSSSDVTNHYYFGTTLALHCTNQLLAIHIGETK